MERKHGLDTADRSFKDSKLFLEKKNQIIKYIKENANCLSVRKLQKTVGRYFFGKVLTREFVENFAAENNLEIKFKIIGKKNKKQN